MCIGYYRKRAKWMAKTCWFPIAFKLGPEQFHGKIYIWHVCCVPSNIRRNWTAQLHSRIVLFTNNPQAYRQVEPGSGMCHYRCTWQMSPVAGVTIAATKTYNRISRLGTLFLGTRSCTKHLSAWSTPTTTQPIIILWVRGAEYYTVNVWGITDSLCIFFLAFSSCNIFGCMVSYWMVLKILVVVNLLPNPSHN